MIKVPATLAGLPAISELISKGINVNVTLIFDLENYRAVAGAYLDGLEKLLANGGELKRCPRWPPFLSAEWTRL